MMGMTEEAQVNENNAIIDHLEAVRQIVTKKCARCGGMCMGCAFDTLDQGMLPAHIDAALALMYHFNNDRREAIMRAEHRIQERRAAWDKCVGQGKCGEAGGVLRLEQGGRF